MVLERRRRFLSRGFFATRRSEVSKDPGLRTKFRPIFGKRAGAGEGGSSKGRSRFSHFRFRRQRQPCLLFRSKKKFRRQLSSPVRGRERRFRGFGCRGEESLYRCSFRLGFHFRVDDVAEDITEHVECDDRYKNSCARGQQPPDSETEDF